MWTRYDGASNMQGEFNGLKNLILKENACAFYVHYFTRQLQIALVIVVKKQVIIALLFNLLSNLYNVVGASCTCRECLVKVKYSRQSMHYKVEKFLGDMA